MCRRRPTSSARHPAGRRAGWVCLSLRGLLRVSKPLSPVLAEALNAALLQRRRDAQPGSLPLRWLRVHAGDLPFVVGLELVVRIDRQGKAELAAALRNGSCPDT